MLCKFLTGTYLPSYSVHKKYIPPIDPVEFVKQTQLTPFLFVQGYSVCILSLSPSPWRNLSLYLQLLLGLFAFLGLLFKHGTQHIYITFVYPLFILFIYLNFFFIFFFSYFASVPRWWTAGRVGTAGPAAAARHAARLHVPVLLPPGAPHVPRLGLGGCTGINQH